MPRRSASSSMKAAFDAHRKSVANQKALTYAPWVLSLLLIITLKDRAAELAVADWAKVGLFVAVLPCLSRMAQKQLEKQRQQAERSIERLLNGRGGFAAVARLQESSRVYRKMEFSATLRQQILSAALSRQEEQEERKRKRERDASMAATPVGV